MFLLFYNIHLNFSMLLVQVKVVYYEKQNRIYENSQLHVILLTYIGLNCIIPLGGI